MGQFWAVSVYGFGGGIYDPVIWRETAGSAKYGAYKAAREAGYFKGRDGFSRFLLEATVRPATASEIEFAPRIETRPVTQAILNGAPLPLAGCANDLFGAGR